MFTALRKYNMWLNPNNCVFGVNSGKFLGFMLTQRRIEANFEKCKAIIEMRSRTNIKEVQRLVGRLTTMSKFLPKLVDKTRPIIHLLKKSTKFAWNDQCKHVFQRPQNNPSIPSNPTKAKHQPPTDSLHHSHGRNG